MPVNVGLFPRISTAVSLAGTPLKIVVSPVRVRVSPSENRCKWACFEIVITILTGLVWSSRHKPRHKPLSIRRF